MNMKKILAAVAAMTILFGAVPAEPFSRAGVLAAQDGENEESLILSSYTVTDEMMLGKWGFYNSTDTDVVWYTFNADKTFDGLSDGGSSFHGTWRVSGSELHLFSASGRESILQFNGTEFVFYDSYFLRKVGGIEVPSSLVAKDVIGDWNRYSTSGSSRQDDVAIYRFNENSTVSVMENGVTTSSGKWSIENSKLVVSFSGVPSVIYEFSDPEFVYTSGGTTYHLHRVEATQYQVTNDMVIGAWSRYKSNNGSLQQTDSYIYLFGSDYTYAVLSGTDTVSIGSWGITNGKLWIQVQSTGEYSTYSYNGSELMSGSSTSYYTFRKSDSQSAFNKATVVGTWEQSGSGSAVYVFSDDMMYSLNGGSSNSWSVIDGRLELSVSGQSTTASMFYIGTEFVLVNGGSVACFSKETAPEPQFTAEEVAGTWELYKTVENGSEASSFGYQYILRSDMTYAKLYFGKQQASGVWKIVGSEAQLTDLSTGNMTTLVYEDSEFTEGSAHWRREQTAQHPVTVEDVVGDWDSYKTVNGVTETTYPFITNFSSGMTYLVTEDGTRLDSGQWGILSGRLWVIDGSSGQHLVYDYDGTEFLRTTGSGVVYHYCKHQEVQPSFTAEDILGDWVVYKYIEFGTETAFSNDRRLVYYKDSEGSLKLMVLVNGYYESEYDCEITGGKLINHTPYGDEYNTFDGTDIISEYDGNTEIYMHRYTYSGTPVTKDIIEGDWERYKAVDNSTGQVTEFTDDMRTMSFSPGENSDVGIYADDRSVANWKIVNGELRVFFGDDDGHYNMAIGYDGTDLTSGENAGYTCYWRRYTEPAPVPTAEETGEKKTYNGHTYQRFDTGMTWDQAEAYCESIGGHLVTITSYGEQKFVESVLSGDSLKNNYWVGGNLENKQLSWVTGEPVTYTYWNTNQPDNYDNDDAVCLPANPESAFFRYGWSDINRSGVVKAVNPNAGYYGPSNFGFVCEWETASNTISREEFIGNWEPYKTVRADGTTNPEDGRLLYIRDDSTAMEVKDGIPTFSGEWDIPENKLHVYTTDGSTDILFTYEDGELSTSTNGDITYWRREGAGSLAEKAVGDWEIYKVTDSATGNDLTSQSSYPKGIFRFTETGEFSYIENGETKKTRFWIIEDGNVIIFDEGETAELHIDGDIMYQSVGSELYFYRKAEDKPAFTAADIVGTWEPYKRAAKSSGSESEAHDFMYKFNADMTFKLFAYGKKYTGTWEIKDDKIYVYRSDLSGYSALDFDGTDIILDEGQNYLHYRKTDFGLLPITADQLIGTWEDYRVTDLYTAEDITSSYTRVYYTFNPDGTYQVCSNGSVSTYNWYIEDGELRTYSTNKDYYAAAVFDGKDLISYTSGNDVHFWHKLAAPEHPCTAEELIGTTWELTESGSSGTAKVTFGEDNVLTIETGSGEQHTEKWCVVNGSLDLIIDGSDTILNYDGSDFYYGDTLHLTKYEPKVLLGDVNGDGLVDPADASLILVENAARTKNEGFFTDEQNLAADIDGNSLIDSVDSSLILAYNAYLTKNDYITLEEWFASL